MSKKIQIAVHLPVIASGAKQSRAAPTGLPRACGARNDDEMRHWHILAVICFYAVLWLFVLPLGLIWAWDVDAMREPMPTDRERHADTALVIASIIVIQVVAVITLRKKPR